MDAPDWPSRLRLRAAFCVCDLRRPGFNGFACLSHARVCGTPRSRLRHDCVRPLYVAALRNPGKSTDPARAFENTPSGSGGMAMRDARHGGGGGKQ